MSWSFSALISIVVIGPLILTFDGVLQLVIKKFIQLLIRKVFHRLYFCNKPSCWSSFPTAINKTSLITFASDSASFLVQLHYRKASCFDLATIYVRTINQQVHSVDYNLLMLRLLDFLLMEYSAIGCNSSFVSLSPWTELFQLLLTNCF